MADDMEYLSVREVAGIFHVSVDTVRNWCKSGRLKAVRPGTKEYRIPRSSLERLTSEAAADEDERLRVAGVAVWERAIAAGLLPSEPTPEVIGRIAGILQRHYADEAL
jgi:excisionase family DNA binding protein